MKMTPLERVMSKIRVDETSGCWLYTGPKRGKGYGYVVIENRNRPASDVREAAHRVAYKGLVGPIPDGFQIDHLCRTPLCVNPAHLEAVTPRENNLRGMSVAAINARKTECVNGHALTPENTTPANGGRSRRCVACRRAARAARRLRENEGRRSA